MDGSGHDHIIGIRTTQDGYEAVNQSSTATVDTSFDCCPGCGTRLHENRNIGFIEWLAHMLRKGSTLDKPVVAAKLRALAGLLED